tara:strand:+ start:311 stop:562 length:252 start_codon:yes stop_codon:yes gene_type:complete
MIFPEPEWIRYRVAYRSPKVGSDLQLKTNSEFAVSKIYIYAHGEQMVRDILADYEVIRIEREDKDGTKEEEIANQFEGFRSSR